MPTKTDEFAYIDWLRQSIPTSPQVLVGPGDDCAVLADSNALPWLVTTDMLLEGTHFRLADAGAYRVGRKAMAVNLSDIAAMGGTPKFAVVSVGLPRSHGNVRMLAEELYRGLADLAAEHATAIVGGDTNTWAGGLVISVTLMGHAGPGGVVRRSGAKPGDWLFVTGPLGGSILGRHFTFQPRLREAAALSTLASLHAMIDLSDGMAGDVGHLCTESGCGVVLHADRIPIHADVGLLGDEKTPLDHALTDGEDFELAFAVPPDDGHRLLRDQPIAGITLHHIGEFRAETGRWLESKTTRIPLPSHGYEHRFAAPSN